MTTLVDFASYPLAKKQSAPRLVEMGTGRLGLWGRPSPCKYQEWHAKGLTTVLTLLSTAEGAPFVGAAAMNAGLVWHWFDQANGKDLPAPMRYALLKTLETINQEINSGSWVLIHCAAGIHRTGMAAYAMLRLRGMDGPAALNLIEQMRPVTREGVGEIRLGWVETWLAEFTGQATQI